MAVQIQTEELTGCKSYFSWIFGQVKPVVAASDLERLEKLCRLLFETDYFYGVEEDGIRAKDATDLRKVYAEKVGSEAGKNEREMDRIWKSVHGKCSALELIFSMCIRLDEMVNEGEEGAMIPMFFLILISNAGLNPEPNLEENGKQKTPEEVWKARIDRLMKREYHPDGSGGGLFPLKKWNRKTGKDQRMVSIWYQMNAWLGENLDEEEHFQVEKWVGKW